MKIFNKSRIAWTISALFLVAVTSCSKDKPAEPSPSGGQILFTSEQAGLTVKSALNIKSDFVADAGSTLKTTINGMVTSWVAGTDVTGIYSTEAHTATSAGGTEGIVNDPYTANTSGPSSWFTALTKMYWGVADTPHHFYAYYPFMAGGSAAAAVPVGLLSTQIQSAANNFDHIGELDFLVATPITVMSPNNTAKTISGSGPNEVRLLYNHLFSIVEFDISGSGPLNGIQLRGTGLALAGATIAITQGTPNPGVLYDLANEGSKADAVIVNLTTPKTLTPTATETKVYMVIYPGFASTCNIDFTSDGGSVWKHTVSKVAPAGGFLRGQYYVVTVDAGAL